MFNMLSSLISPFSKTAGNKVFEMKSQKGFQDILNKVMDGTLKAGKYTAEAAARNSMRAAKNNAAVNTLKTEAKGITNAAAAGYEIQGDFRNMQS